MIGSEPLLVDQQPLGREQAFFPSLAPWSLRGAGLTFQAQQPPSSSLLTPPPHSPHHTDPTGWLDSLGGGFNDPISRGEGLVLPLPRGASVEQGGQISLKLSY